VHNIFVEYNAALYSFAILVPRFVPLTVPLILPLVVSLHLPRISVQLDPWHTTRLLPILERLEQKLLRRDTNLVAKLAASTLGSSSASSAQLHLQPLLRPYMLLLEQAEARGAALASIVCIFDAMQRVVALLQLELDQSGSASSSSSKSASKTAPPPLAVPIAAYNIVLAACARFENANLCARFANRALELRRRGLGLQHVARAWANEGRHGAAQEMAVAALEAFCSGLPASASATNLGSNVSAAAKGVSEVHSLSSASVFSHAQHAPTAMLSIALQSAAAQHQWDAVEQLCQRYLRPHHAILFHSADVNASEAPAGAFQVDDINRLPAAQRDEDERQLVLTLLRIHSQAAALTAPSTASVVSSSALGTSDPSALTADRPAHEPSARSAAATGAVRDIEHCLHVLSDGSSSSSSSSHANNRAPHSSSTADSVRTLLQMGAAVFARKQWNATDELHAVCASRILFA
jgi:hypothetical protein